MTDVNTTGLHAHPSRTSAHMPYVPGFCPACGHKSLFAGSGGYITCSVIECPNPTAVSDALADERGWIARALADFAQGRHPTSAA